MKLNLLKNLKHKPNKQIRQNLLAVLYRDICNFSQLKNAASTTPL